MIKLKNNILVDKDGYILRPKELPILDLQYRLNRFPPRQGTGEGGNGTWNMSSRGPNKIFIDLGEDIPIWSMEFNRNNNVNYSISIPPLIYQFPDSQLRTAKVWFEHPSRVYGFFTNYVYFAGEFPKDLTLFNLSNLTLNQGSFDSFPVILKSGIFTNLTLGNITTNRLNYIPNWITQSKITVLNLIGTFNLIDKNINNMDKLINIKGLAALILNVPLNVNSFHDNLKDISTLRSLIFGGSSLPSLTQEITNCKQLTTIAAGYYNSTSSNSAFNSWGTGITNMKLTTLIFNACYNLPTDPPLGIETVPTLKTYSTGSSYKTPLRSDESIIKMYDKVKEFASKSVGNTLLRQVTWSNGIATSVYGYNTRPTGTYQQPSGYVQGSSNGTPASPMEMVWVLVNQYKWKITLTNEAGNGSIVYQ